VALISSKSRRPRNGSRASGTIARAHQSSSHSGLCRESSLVPICWLDSCSHLNWKEQNRPVPWWRCKSLESFPRWKLGLENLHRSRWLQVLIWPSWPSSQSQKAFRSSCYVRLTRCSHTERSSGDLPFWCSTSAQSNNTIPLPLRTYCPLRRHRACWIHLTSLDSRPCFWRSLTDAHSK
jgi:hypothetical protein